MWCGCTMSAEKDEEEWQQLNDRMVPLRRLKWRYERECQVGRLRQVVSTALAVVLAVNRMSATSVV